MNLLFADNLFGEQLLRNISWTLVHSVWQGMAAAILAMLILTTTRKASAALRYNLLLIVLFLFCGAVVTTFLLQPAIAETSAGLTGQLTSGTGIQQYQSALISSSEANALTSIFSFLNANSQVIVLSWLLLTAIRFTQLVIGYYGISRIKRAHVMDAGDFWNERLAQLANSIMLSRPVKLLQSALVTTPTVISYFKPVIMVPAGLLTSLPPAEIEAILLHELSHIRRKDFLVNLLQSFIETIFFFNPFIFWISNLVREERENCCDDVAVAHLGNKTTLIKAMISCMEFKGKEAPGYALTFGGRRKQMLDRAKRILNKTSRPFRAAEKMVLGLCIPLAAILVIFLLQAFQPKKNAASAIPSPVVTDTIPKKASVDNGDETSGTVTHVKGVAHYHYLFKRKSGVYQVEKVKGQIVSLNIDGKTIARENIQSHLAVVNPMIDEYNNIMKQPFAPLAPLSSELMVPLSPLRGEMIGLTDPGEVKADGSVSRTSKYFDNGYKVVVQDSVVKEVYYKGSRLTAEEIAEQKDKIDAIFKGRE